MITFTYQGGPLNGERVDLVTAIPAGWLTAEWTPCTVKRLVNLRTHTARGRYRLRRDEAGVYSATHVPSDADVPFPPLPEPEPEPEPPEP